MSERTDQSNTVPLVAAAAIGGAAAIVGAMLVIDVDKWDVFVGYFVLVPVANVLFAIALWLGISALRGDR